MVDPAAPRDFLMFFGQGVSLEAVKLYPCSLLDHSVISISRSVGLVLETENFEGENGLAIGVTVVLAVLGLETVSTFVEFSGLLYGVIRALSHPDRVLPVALYIRILALLLCFVTRAAVDTW
jgi:hypothetical protein